MSSWGQARKGSLIYVPLLNLEVLGLAKYPFGLSVETAGTGCAVASVHDRSDWGANPDRIVQRNCLLCSGISPAGVSHRIGKQLMAAAAIVLVAGVFVVWLGVARGQISP